MPPFYEIVTAVALVTGTFLMIVASIGLLRFPDVFCRMHAAGKASTLGVVLLLIAAVVMLMAGGDGPQWSFAIRGALAIAFQFLTTPTATHLLARAAYLSDYPLTSRTALDELKDYLPSRPDYPTGQE